MICAAAGIILSYKTNTDVKSLEGGVGKNIRIFWTIILER